MVPSSFLSIVFFPDLRVRICHFHIELRSPQDNLLPLLRGHVVSNFRAIFAVMHHQKVQLVHVAYHIFVKSVRQKIACFFI